MGETRSQYNERFSQAHLNQDYEIPEVGEYLWDWYCDLLGGFTSVVDGNAIAIPPSEFAAWVSLTGNVVRPEEYAILRQIDNARRDAMNAEIKRSRDRQKAEADAKAAKPKGKGKR